MKQLAPVQFFEGLFLRPHHLQQQTRYHDDNLAKHLELVNRYHWGVATLEINESALKNQVVEVPRCTVVFPDGRIASVPENAQVVSNSFEDRKPAGAEPLQVYLCLPRIKPNEPNVIKDGQVADDVRRFRLRSREVHDEASGDQPTTVAFAVANVHILFGGDDRTAFESVKIAEITQRGADQFEVSRAYIPPCLSIDASRDLQKCCMRIRDEVTARARRLHEMKREGGEASSSVLIWLVTINSYLALLNQLIATSNCHPFHFHGVLLQLAGALSSFADQAEAWDLEPYVHDDPAPAFRGLEERIKRYLLYVDPVSFVEVTLRWSPSEECYSASLTDEHFGDGFMYYLGFSGQDAPEDLQRDVQKKAKVGAPGRIREITHRNLRGTRIKPIDNPPGDLPKRPSAYFTLDAVGHDWERIEDDKSIAISLMGMGDLTVSLFVLSS